VLRLEPTHIRSGLIYWHPWSCVEASDGAIAPITIMCGHISAFSPLLSNDLDNLGERFTNFVHVPVSHSIAFDSYVSLGLRKFLYGS
jgi:hypothetical protein